MYARSFSPPWKEDRRRDALLALKSPRNHSLTKEGSGTFARSSVLPPPQTRRPLCAPIARSAR